MVCTVSGFEGAKHIVNAVQQGVVNLSKVG